MPIDKLTIEKSLNPSTGIEMLKVTGPVVLATLFEFQDALREAVGPKILIDLSGAPYMDSAGLGAILSFYASAQRRGTRYAIAGMASRVRIMFEACKVDKFLALSPTVEEAERSLL